MLSDIGEMTQSGLNAVGDCFALDTGRIIPAKLCERRPKSDPVDYPVTGMRPVQSRVSVIGQGRTQQQAFFFCGKIRYADIAQCDVEAGRYQTIGSPGLLRVRTDV
jgi:hypothetical protein